MGATGMALRLEYKMPIEVPLLESDVLNVSDIQARAITQLALSNFYQILADRTGSDDERERYERQVEQRRIRYEDLISDPRVRTRKLGAHATDMWEVSGGKLIFNRRNALINVG